MQTTFAAGLGRDVLICIHAPHDTPTLACTTLSAEVHRLLFWCSGHLVVGLGALDWADQ